MAIEGVKMAFEALSGIPSHQLAFAIERTCNTPWIMKKKRQHFVWSAYLEPWTVAGTIACWRKGNIFETAPRNVAVETHFYRVREISRRDRNTIQQMIQRFHPDLRPMAEDWLKVFTFVGDLRRKYLESGAQDPELRDVSLRRRHGDQLRD